METFLEAIYESLFSSYVSFLIVSAASQKPRLFNAVFQSREQVKDSCSQVRRVWRMLRYYHFVAKKSFTKPDRCSGALSLR